MAKSSTKPILPSTPFDRERSASEGPLLQPAAERRQKDIPDAVKAASLATARSLAGSLSRAGGAGGRGGQELRDAVFSMVKTLAPEVDFSEVYLEDFAAASSEGGP